MFASIYLSNLASFFEGGNKPLLPRCHGDGCVHEDDHVQDEVMTGGDKKKDTATITATNGNVVRVIAAAAGIAVCTLSIFPADIGVQTVAPLAHVPVPSAGKSFLQMYQAFLPQHDIDSPGSTRVPSEADSNTDYLESLEPISKESKQTRSADGLIELRNTSLPTTVQECRDKIDELLKVLKTRIESRTEGEYAHKSETRQLQAEDTPITKKIGDLLGRWTLLISDEKGEIITDKKHGTQTQYSQEQDDVLYKCQDGIPSLKKKTIEYVPNVLTRCVWHVEDSLALKLHLFTDASETYIHNHKSSFNSMCLWGTYTHTTWTVNQDSKADAAADPFNRHHRWVRRDSKTEKPEKLMNDTFGDGSHAGRIVPATRFTHLTGLVYFIHHTEMHTVTSSLPSPTTQNVTEGAVTVSGKEPSDTDDPDLDLDDEIEDNPLDYTLTMFLKGADGPSPVQIMAKEPQLNEKNEATSEFYERGSDKANKTLKDMRAMLYASAKEQETIMLLGKKK